METSSDWHKEYSDLLQAIINTGELVKGQPAGHDDRLLAAEGLLFKVFDLACTAFNIYEGDIECPNVPAYYHPISSINVIARSAYEAFLIFNYVFIGSQSPEEQDMRYWLWKRDSLIEWKEYAEQSSQSNEILSGIEKSLDDANGYLSGNVVFAKFDEKQKRAMLGKNRWKPGNNQIAKEAGIGVIFREKMYKYLCGYAHSGYISIMQIQDADNRGKKEEMIKASLKMIMLSMGIMIRRYIALWGLNLDTYPDEQKAAIVIWGGVATNRAESTAELIEE